MTISRIAMFLAFAVACINPMRADENSLRLSVSPGVTVPNMGDLKAKLEQGFAQRSGKTYTRQGDKWVEIKPQGAPEGLSAVVLSYDEKERRAVVGVEYPEYKMPIVQFWRFNGRTWTDRIDPGIFVR